GLRSELRVGVRTGDTPQKERAAMLRQPPDILITTPESLFLLLTSRARETLTSVETVIVDEVHAVAGTKRGAHLALSLERLQRLVGEPVQRIGLSATQRPLEEIGRFVSGGREIELVDAGRAKEIDLRVVVPLDDMREPEEQQSIWPSIYPEILELVRAHRSTIVFVNNRRLAERLALRLNDLAEEELARRPGPADRRDLSRRGDARRGAARARARRLSVRRPLARPARERPRHARRPLPLRRVRRAAGPGGLGPHGRRRAGPPGCEAARGHERGHDPRPRPFRSPSRRR